MTVFRSGDVRRAEKASSDTEKFLKAIGFGKDESVWITQYDTWPIRGGFRSEFTLVGRGAVRSSYCGKHKCFLVCPEVEKHVGEFVGMDIWLNSTYGCFSPSCPCCFKYKWAVRQANNMDSRFKTAEKVLGLRYVDVEHLFASVPEKAYGLSYEALSKGAISAFKASGMLDGATIFHSHRKDRTYRDLVWSPHFHGLGYVSGVEGGYDRCRSCSHLCCSSRGRVYCDFEGECSGFEQLTRRVHKDDGWIVALAKNEKGVAEKRKDVFGTAWYQLEHAGLKVGVNRFQIVKWFGDLNNRKFKTVHEKFKPTCVVCKSPLNMRSLPFGVERFPVNRGERGFLKNFTLPHVDDDGGL